MQGSRSLKDKRQVLRGITARLRNSYNVSIVEVGDADHLQLIEFGIAMVGREDYTVRTTLQKIQETLRAHPVAEYLDGELELI